MITGELKSKVDRIWDTMWSGGISNPLSVIEQLTYLLFIKRLDELHTLKEVEYEAVEYDPPQVIMERLAKLEEEIAKGRVELAGLWHEPISHRKPLHGV
jgi:hypothetical protein